MERVNTENPVHAFGKRTRTQHLANAQVKVLYLFLYPPSKKPLFFVFWCGKSKSEGSESNLGGSTVGSLPGGPTGGPRLWGLCAGGEIVSGLPLVERNGIESTVRIMATHYLPPPCHVQIYSFFSRLHLKHKMDVAWKG